MTAAFAPAILFRHADGNGYLCLLRFQACFVYVRSLEVKPTFNCSILRWRSNRSCRRGSIYRNLISSDPGCWKTSR